MTERKQANQQLITDSHHLAQLAVTVYVEISRYWPDEEAVAKAVDVAVEIAKESAKRLGADFRVVGDE